jgi:hypothetical protein
MKIEKFSAFMKNVEYDRKPRVSVSLDFVSKLRQIPSYNS